MATTLPDLGPAPAKPRRKRKARTSDYGDSPSQAAYKEAIRRELTPSQAEGNAYAYRALRRYIEAKKSARLAAAPARVSYRTPWPWEK